MKILEKLNTKKSYNVITAIVLILIAVFMLYWIGEKEGYHEDEIFSYGSSNYKWDNLFQAAGKSDYLNRAIEQYIIGDSIGETLENIKYYLNNQDEFSSLASEIQKADKPVWKTSEDAEEYVTIQDGDVLNYLSVYYNQSRDVHPPLFYILVHFASSINFGTFSKYTVFFINLIFILLTCYTIRKIFKLFDKKWLGLIAMALYGFSMGATSTTIFLRMYAMITFFSLEYLYLNLQILKQDLNITKSDKWKLFFTILLGFLTQYYFCIFVVLVFILMCIRMIYKKQYRTLGKYTLIHIVTAIVGVVLFPMSIYHIFFSYRGAAGLGSSSLAFGESLKLYVSKIAESFSINNILIYAIIIAVIIGIIVRLVKRHKNIDWYLYILIAVPIVIYFFIIVAIAPDVDSKYATRYIMIILPELAILFTLAVYKIFENQKIAYGVTVIATVVITGSGIITNEPNYLYRGYNNYLEIAEEYQDLDYVYAVDNAFTYLNSMPEFMIYNKTMIINMSYDDLAFLQTDEELQSQSSFILSIKKWMNIDDTLNQILYATGFLNYEVLLDQDDDTQSIIYLVTR